MEKNCQIMILEKNMNNLHELYRLKKGDYLRLCIGHSIQGKHVRIFTNYPIHSTTFIRNVYHQLDITNPTSSKNPYDSFDNFVEFETTLPGAFQFYFTDDGSSDIGKKIGEGQFIIDPQFSVGNSNWGMDKIVLQTYLAKNLGPLHEWESRLCVAIHGNYNMIHFTPLQELGYSRSAYSLRDQLKVNPWFSADSKPATWGDIEEFVKHLSDDYQVLSMTDLVYNHTSNDSPWLHEHPECGYNIVNSPHLRPAYLLDRVIWNLTVDVANNKYAHYGLTNVVNESYHLDIIRNVLSGTIRDLKLHEFFLAHVDNAVNDFKEYLEKLEKSNDRESYFKSGELMLNHGKYQRLKSAIDNGILASHFYRHHNDNVTACLEYRHLLGELNDKSYHQIQSHLDEALNNVMANIHYRFVDHHGLRLNRVTTDTPLMWFYFYHPNPEIVTLEDCENSMEMEERIMAFNGWVMGHDGLTNFAEEPSQVYLRRELIVWGDSVKLRYGKSPVDCPYLWDHMFKYTELTAKIFHGVRLDNCHSTPIHVAQAMLDRARVVRPDLYVVAELFTGNEGIDKFFVNKLGINSLIREAQSAGNCSEQSRLAQQYSSLPVGAFTQPSTQILRASNAHALFCDMTHDNHSPVGKRSPFDLLPSAAIVGMARCAIGSTRGYEEMVPHYIDVVNEERFYSKWGESIGLDTSIVHAKSIVNELHQRLDENGYDECFVEQLDGEVVAITRRSSKTYRSVLMVAHTAFNYPGHAPFHRFVREINLAGKVTKILFEGRTVRNEQLIDCFTKHDSYINGLPDVFATVFENKKAEESTMISVVKNEATGYDTIYFKNFPAGCVIAIETEMIPEQVTRIDQLHRELSRESNVHGHTLLGELLKELSINDLNRLLFRCNEEEKAEFNTGSYHVANFGNLVFCGLQGIASEMDSIRHHNDLGHPICENLRQGDWLMDYITERLIQLGGSLKEVGEWFQRSFESVKHLPRFLVPAYFDRVVSFAHKLAFEECYNQLGDVIRSGSSFLKNLALGSVMLCSEMRNCKMPPLTIQGTHGTSTLSAGFPHFAEGIWRNWGRDTFISLRGLTILTGRFEEARSIILTYAATIRHGLVPNLLADGLVSRYNARDATWFWLQSIKEYELSQAALGDNAVSCLHLPVSRMFPSDESDGQHVVEQPLCDVIQEVLQRHADGISFIERNAGYQIDQHMVESGFRVEAGLQDGTKFPFGGNKFNCGTWMDKMGSCSHAGNKGRPATPRDGCDVELVGLCASVLDWLSQLTKDGKYFCPGVKYKGELLTWGDWYISIKENFDDMFFIPLNTAEHELVSHRGVYRDTINSSLGYTDSQLRPNFLIAMTTAPALFNVEHAWHALELVEKDLLGYLGMRTLCPHDWEYRGYYDNSNDSSDASVSHGFNYHQGPEWLWLTGYYIRSKLIFSQQIHDLNPAKYSNVVKDTVSHVTEIFGRLHHHIKNSKWRSLPELTNKDGEHCHHSCDAQAWSVACTFEALIDLIGLPM